MPPLSIVVNIKFLPAIEVISILPKLARRSVDNINTGEDTVPEPKENLDAQVNADLASENSLQVWDTRSMFSPVTFQMVVRHY